MNWMDGNREMERSREVLKSILSLLLALAGLAEAASGRSGPVRFFVLAVLRRAEAVARSMVIGMAHEFGAPIVSCRREILQPSASQETDAERLIRSFRELALLLERMLTQARFWARRAGDTAERYCARLHRVLRLESVVTPPAGWPVVPAFPAPDTS